MIVLGIDPGTAATGYGLIKKNPDSMKVIDYGVITTSSKQSGVNRLKTLHRRVTELIMIHRPTDLAVEQLFFNTNITTAISVGQARGVVLLAAADADVVLGEYTPLQVKQAVTGYGNASKTQIQQMIKAVLGLQTVPRPDDAADALAVAVCHINSSKLLKKVEARLK